MLPFKKILCPTDFSNPSYEALKLACELALHFSSEIILMHVVSPIPVLATSAHEVPISFDVTSYQQELLAQERQTLEETARTRVPREISVSTRVVLGDPADEIIAMSEREKVDVIVVATHGLKGWRLLISGSVTAKVIRYATRPVLSVQGAPRQE